MTSLLTELQQAAVDRFARLRVGAVFLEQGTGKTRIAVELANRNPHVTDVVWVGPFSTLPTIKDEAAKWGLRPRLRTVGYETLSASDRVFLELLPTVHAGTMIVADESVFIKNPESKRTRRVWQLRQQAGFALALCGTPVVRDLWDLKTQIDWLSPRIIGMDDRVFRDSYFKQISYRKAGGDKRQFDRLYEPNVAHLLSLIRPYVVEGDLTIGVPVAEHRLLHEPGDEAADEYARLRGDMLDRLEQLELVDVKGYLLRLAIVAATDPTKCEAIAATLAGRCLVFCNYLAEADAIGEHVEHLRIDGSMTVAEREQVIQQHQASNLPLLLTYGTSAYGLNLQYCSIAHFASVSFDWGRLDQAKARVRRLGQTDPITYVTHRSELKIDRFIDANLNNKTWLADLTRSQIEEEL